MKFVAGAILILAGEQAFLNAYLIGFPHQANVRSVLLPFAGACVLVGTGLLVAGFMSDRKPS